MNELRSPLVDALERLTADLVIGRHGDPHVAFVVMIHPDQHPTIVALSPAGSHDLATMIVRPATEPAGESRPRLFGYPEFHEAADALDDAKWAWRSFGSLVADGEEGRTLGQHIDSAVRTRWERRRDSVLASEMERAAFEESHRSICEFCLRRFTDRGLIQHRARSRWVGCRDQDARPSAERVRPPAIVKVACALPECPWTGLDDQRSHHMETAHADRYVVG